MLGFLIILIIVIFGGALALLGDRVGMKVGKKRLSIFGLRPKYTSMIITVLTGFFIAGLTMAVLTSLSEYMRIALFELGTIRQELEVTSSKNQRLTEEIGHKEKEFNTLTAEHQQLQVQKREIETLLTQTRKKQAEVARELKLKQQRVNNLSQINDDLTQDIIDKEMEISRYTQQIENLEGHLMQLSRLNDQNQTIISKPILFMVGEILSDRVVEPGISLEHAFESILEPMLNEANEAAFNRGARIPGKTNYALRTIPRRVAEVCVQLSELTERAVVRVVVDKNSVADEPVTVTIEVYPDQVVFQNGEVIAQTQVNGKAQESVIRDHILSLLILANNQAVETGVDAESLRDLIPVSEMAKMINTIKLDPEATFLIKLIADGDIYRINQFKVKLMVEKI